LLPASALVACAPLAVHVPLIPFHVCPESAVPKLDAVVLVKVSVTALTINTEATLKTRAVAPAQVDSRGIMQT